MTKYFFRGILWAAIALFSALGARQAAAQPLAGFNASFSGSAEAEGIGFEVGYIADSAWLAALTFGAIYSPFQMPAGAKPLVDADKETSYSGEFNDGPEIFTCLNIDHWIIEDLMFGLMGGMTWQARANLFQSRDSSTGAIQFYTSPRPGHVYHLLIGAELRYFLSPSFAVLASIGTRRGKIFGGTIIF